MKRIASVLKLIRGMVLLPVALAAFGQAYAQDAKPFSKEQLDQMTAQIALYPDALLSQLLMATTYPTNSPRPTSGRRRTRMPRATTRSRWSKTSIGIPPSRRWWRFPRC